MPDYAKMYRELFNAVTDAVEILQKAQIRTEELYMADENPVIQLLKPEPSEAEASPENESDVSAAPK